MASGGGDARSLRVESYVRGYHVYQRIWNPFVGEVAVAVREEGDVHDRYAVAILESDTCSWFSSLRPCANECIILIMRHIE